MIKQRGLARLGVVAVFGVLLAADAALAQTADSEYFERLAITQRAVSRHRAHALNAGADVRAAQGLRQRSYHAGDTWTVAFTPSDDTMARKSGSPEDLASAPRKPFYYDFRVTAVDGSQTARIEVRQRATASGDFAEPRVDHMTLSIDSNFVVVRKQITYRDGRADRIIMGNGHSNVSGGFESFPIDLPDLGTAEGEVLSDNPAELKRAIDRQKTLDFHFDDLYARPVRAIWQDGDPWPALVKSPAGTAVLVAVGRRS